MNNLLDTEVDQHTPSDEKNKRATDTFQLVYDDLLAGTSKSPKTRYYQVPVNKDVGIKETHLQVDQAGFTPFPEQVSEVRQMYEGKTPKVERFTPFETTHMENRPVLETRSETIQVVDRIESIVFLHADIAALLSADKRAGVSKTALDIASYFFDSVHRDKWLQITNPKLRLLIKVKNLIGVNIIDFGSFSSLAEIENIASLQIVYEKACQDSMNINATVDTPVKVLDQRVFGDSFSTDSLQMISTIVGTDEGENRVNIPPTTIIDIRTESVTIGGIAHQQISKLPETKQGVARYDLRQLKVVKPIKITT